MNEIYKQSLNGMLASTIGESIPNGIGIYNLTEVPLVGSWVSIDGAHLSSQVIEPKQCGCWSPANVGDHFLFTSALSGAFVTVVTIVDGITKYQVTCEQLSKPNDIGGVPQPTQEAPIPISSPRVLVGCGVLPNNNIVTREQFWERSGDSYVLAPGEKRVVSYTETSGMEQTTSEQDTVSTSVGASASGGWGPISASISASLSKTSTTFQQVTARTQTTRYESVELLNKSAHPEMVLKWALTDVITIFEMSDKQLKPVSSIVSRERPELVAAYNLESLPAVPTLIVELADLTKVPQPCGCTHVKLD